MSGYRKRLAGAKLQKPDIERVGKLLDERGLKGIDAETAASRWVRHRATDERVDYAGDIVRAKGGNLAPWLANAQIFLNHNAHDLSQKIGHGLSAEKIAGDSPAIYLEYFILTAEQSGNPLTETAWKMIRSGMLPDGSIGFHVDSRDGIRDPKPEERSKWGMDPYRGVEFVKWTLDEFSCVTGGCNSGAKVDAMAKAMKAGVFTAADREAVRSSAVDDLLALFDHAEYKAAPTHSVSVPDLSILSRRLERLEKGQAHAIPPGHLLVPQSVYDDLAGKMLATVEAFAKIQPAASGTPAEPAAQPPAEQAGNEGGNTSRTEEPGEQASQTQE